MQSTIIAWTPERPSNVRPGSPHDQGERAAPRLRPTGSAGLRAQKIRLARCDEAVVKAGWGQDLIARRSFPEVSQRVQVEMDQLQLVRHGELVAPDCLVTVAVDAEKAGQARGSTV